MSLGQQVVLFWGGLVRPRLLRFRKAIQAHVITTTAFGLLSWAMWLMLSMPAGLITVALCLLVLDWKIERDRKEAH